MADAQVVAGKYVLEEELGRGGFGTVYKALHQDLQKHVALKVMNPDLANDEAAQRRFLREVEATTSFVHKYAVQLRDFGRDAQRRCLYYTMDLVDGPTLRKVLREQGPLEERRAVRLVGQMLEALEEAHEAKLVHRDLKPENLVLAQGARGEEVRVLDFGIAKAVSQSRDATSPLTLEGQTVGTLAYMSPEQADGQRLDGRSDLYSVAVVLYELLSGRRPIEADPGAEDSVRQFLTRLIMRPPTPLLSVAPHVTPAVATVIHRCLSKEPKDRLDTALAMRDALVAALPQDDVGASPTPVPEDEGSAVTMPPTTLAALEAAAAAEASALTGAYPAPASASPPVVDQRTAAASDPAPATPPADDALTVPLPSGLPLGDKPTLSPRPIEELLGRPPVGRLVAVHGSDAPADGATPAPAPSAPPPSGVGRVLAVVVALTIAAGVAVLALDVAGLGTRARRALARLQGGEVRTTTPPPGAVIGAPKSTTTATGPVPVKADPPPPVTEVAPPRVTEAPPVKTTPPVAPTATDGARPTLPMLLVIESPQDGAVVEAEVHVRGVVLGAPAGTPTEVRVGPFRVDLVEGAFERVVRLPAGAQVLEVVAKNGRQEQRASRRVLAVTPSPLPATTDVLEPNDSAAAAKPLPPGVTQRVLLEAGGEDFYRVDVPALHELRVGVGFQHAAGDVDLELLDERGQVVSSARGTTNVESVRVWPRRAGRYVLRVHGATNTYSLVSDLAPRAADNAFEPNDQPADAAPLSPGEYPSLRCTGDDYYRVTAPVGHGVELSIDFQHAQGDLELVLLDEDLRELAGSRSSVDREVVRTIAPASGLLLARVFNAQSTYALKLDVRPPPAPDAREPNDSAQQAVALGPGTYARLVTDPVDWYRIALPPAHAAQVTVTYAQGSDLGVALVSTDGTSDLRAARSGSGRDALTLASRNGGNLLVRVDAGSFVDYTLRVQVTPLSSMTLSDAFEPNDLPMDAAPLAAGTHTGLVCEGDDWFAVPLARGGRLELTLEFVHAQGDIDVALFAPDGSEVAQSNGTEDRETISHVAAAAGTYLLRVYTRGEANAYSLRLAGAKGGIVRSPR